MSERVRNYSDAEFAHYLEWPPLIDALDSAFKSDAECPTLPGVSADGTKVV